MCGFNTWGGEQFTKIHWKKRPRCFLSLPQVFWCLKSPPASEDIAPPFLLGIPTWLPRCLARWKSSKAPSRKKSYQPSKLMDILQMILLMEEILHHLGCIYIYNLGCTDKTLQNFFHQQYFRVTAQMMSLKAEKKWHWNFSNFKKSSQNRIPDPIPRVFLLKESRFCRHVYQCALVLEASPPRKKKTRKNHEKSTCKDVTWGDRLLEIA